MLWGNRHFEGQVPKLSARLLPENAAQAAKNLWLDRGYPQPLPNPVAVDGVGQFEANVKAVWRFDETRWFQWDEDVDVVRAPVIEDSTRRTIWSGDLYPRHTSTAIMRGGNFASPGTPVSRRLGVPAPDNAPSVQAGNFVDEDDSQAAETHAWAFTFVTDLDEEGPPSDPSASIARGFNVDGSIRPVTVTMPTGLTGAYASAGVNRKRVYRVATGTSGSTYQLVATVALSQGNFVDTVQTANLGDTLPSLTWDPPPADLKGLIALPNGVLAGFVGRDVWFSEPYQPHAWPSDYVQTVDADIVGLGNFGLNIVVGTKGKPYIISGSSPAGAAVARMELDQICAGKHGFASVDQDGLVFASTEGLVQVGPAGGQVVSRDSYDRADWQALKPGLFNAIHHDGAYLAFSVGTGSTGETLALNPEMAGSVAIADADVQAVFHDTERDKVYIVQGRRLKEWKSEPDAADPKRPMTWRSRLHVAPGRTFTAAQVIAEGYPVTLTLTGDGAQRFTKSVADARPFRLSNMGLHSEWYYEIAGTNAVVEVRIGSMEEMLS